LTALLLNQRYSSKHLDLFLWLCIRKRRRGNATDTQGEENVGLICRFKRGIMEIKDRIKEIRLAVGITQAKFAERTAISTSYISEIENGLKEANERVIRLVAAEFNANEHWLRTGQGSMFNEDISANMSEAMGMFKSLDQRFQSGVLQILAVLTKMNDEIRQENISE